MMGSSTLDIGWGKIEVNAISLGGLINGAQNQFPPSFYAYLPKFNIPFHQNAPLNASVMMFSFMCGNFHLISLIFCVFILRKLNH